MTEVTDKMVYAGASALAEAEEQALEIYRETYLSRARITIEAALAARKTVDAGEFVEELKGYVQSTCKCPLDKCADTIEELVDALKPFAEVAGDNVGVRPFDVARALLTRMGVKL